MVWKLKRFFSRHDNPLRSDSRACFERGIDHVLQQRWRLAEECFREAVASDPQHADAHAYLGNVLRQLGDWGGAILAYDESLAIKADAEVYYNRGTLLAQKQEFNAALKSFESALAINASMVSAHCRMADALRNMGQLEAAEARYRHVVAMMPENAEAHYYIGILRSAAASHAEALSRFDAAIQIEPTYASAHSGRGSALMALGRPRDALLSFDVAIALKPDSARAFSNRAQAQAALGMLTEARSSHEQAAMLDPQDAEIHFSHGAFLSDLNDWPAAAKCYELAIGLRPDYADAHCNLGLVQQEMGQADLALSSYSRSLTYNPKLATAFNNRGNLFRSRKQFAEAWHDYRKAVALSPGYADAHYNIGQLALIEGNFAIGWSEYEWRGLIEEAKATSQRKPTEVSWLGEPSLQGKQVFVYAEQGLGDTIQFCRYATLLAARGGRVILEVQPSLGDLLADLDGVSEIVLAGSHAPLVDFQCSLMSLPGAFKTTLETIPCKVPYLNADPRLVERWQEMQGPRVRLRVGLAWSGNPHHSNDKRRSIALEQMIAHLPNTFEYYSLQNEIRDSDLRSLRSYSKVKINETRLNTFMDTAALLETLDLVISVDTSVAHLSGAMGKPTWLLLPFFPDWRWMLDRRDSPWYPTMTLYRQAVADDWAGPLAEIERDLLECHRGRLLMEKHVAQS